MSGEGNREPRTPPRVADLADLDDLTRVLTAAFEHDPLWSWVFPRTDDLAAWWRFILRSALRYRSVWILGEFAAVSVWIPPGGSELTEPEESQVEPLLRSLVGTRTPEVLEVLARFDAAHPTDEPHYYLSLLGVDPDYRGQGLGMSLLAENLASLDAEGVPSYLESTNPANDRRYERVGYRRIGEFTTPGGERTVGTMWRAARD